MANTRYYTASNYKHHRTGSYPARIDENSFPVCIFCGKEIYCDDSNKEWACSDPTCIMR